MSITEQLLGTQKRAHDIDKKERDRIEGLRKQQRDHEYSNSKRSRLDSLQPGAAFPSPNLKGTSNNILGEAFGGDSSQNNNINSNHHQKTSSAEENKERFISVCCSTESKEERRHNVTTLTGEERSAGGDGDEKCETFATNSITTSRYSLHPLRLNFILYKNLYEQFHRRANWFFFVVGVLELVPIFTSFSAVTLITLTVVLLLGMFRSLFEDLKRQAADRLTNNQTVLVLKSFHDTEWRTCTSSQVSVGDIVLLETSARNVAEAIPCDILLLASSEVDDTCAVQSAHIDGEAKWTMKRALSVTKVPGVDRFIDGDELGERFVAGVTRMFDGMTVTCEKPDGNINEFSGRIKLRGSLLEEFPVKIPQLLLRGTQLRKAKWIIGVVIYTGNETKALMGHQLPTRKWSRIENTINTLILASLLIYLAIVVGNTIVGTVIMNDYPMWYLSADKLEHNNWAVLFFSFIIFFDNAIPISLYVSLEIVELVAAFLIEMDLCMYDATLDRTTAIRAPELLPDLGQVHYLFCDKTGTVTKNELSLRKFAVRGVVYGTGTTEIGRAVMRSKGEQVLEAWRRADENGGYDESNCPFYDPRFDEETWFTHVDGPYLEKLFTAMAICHTANISLKYLKLRKRMSKNNRQKLSNIKKYDGESPDECALCEAARKFGVEFVERKGDMITIESRNGSRNTYVIRDVLPFTSDRRRMSVLVELLDGSFRLYSKGADSALFPLAVNNSTTRSEQEAADQLAAEGLRTLVFAERKLSKRFVSEWLRRDVAVKTAGDFYFESAQNLRSNLASEIEKDLNIIGVTGMEDMLQYGVPDCIKAMRQANIKTWLVTGDSREAAINIGYSCSLVPIEAHILELYGIMPENVNDLRTQLLNPIAPMLYGEAAAAAAKMSSSGRATTNNNNAASPPGSPMNVALDASGSFGSPTIASIIKSHATGGNTSHFDNIPMLNLDQSVSNNNNTLNTSGENLLGSPLLSSSDNSGLGDIGISLSGEYVPGAASSSEKRSSSSSTNKKDKKSKEKEKARLYVAILDGTTFTTLLDHADEELQAETFKALSKCASVLCARFSSSQKAKAVQFIRTFSQKIKNETVVSVAVGDGTNDIPMLRAANVGIGMFGVENYDAANAGDFAIGQFWFLQRLLLVHGRSSYRRSALVIKYFLYKNLLYVLMLFFFSVQSGFSPQFFVPADLLGLYNIAFTSIPIIIAGIMDRDVFHTDDATRHFQELYWPGQKSSYLNLRGLLPWIATAGLHAVIIYAFTQLVYDDPINSSGVTMGADASALTTYTTVIVAANIHLGFHLASVTSLTFLGFWVSVIGWFFFMMLYSALPPTRSGVSYRAFNNVGFQLLPWVTAFMAIQLCSAREATLNFFVYNLYPFARMSLKRILQLADSKNSREASTKPPYELEAIAHAEKTHTLGSRAGGAGAQTTVVSLNSQQNSLSSINDTDISDQLNFFLQFKDGETEEHFIESFLGNLTRYKVGCGIAAVFSGGITFIAVLGVVRGTGSSIVEVFGWGLFCLVAVTLLVIFMTQEPAKVRPVLHQLMLVCLLIAFGGMSIANFVASQRAPDTHPVSMAVSVFGLLVVVRPPLVHILQYLVLGVTSLAMWYQIFRVKQWGMTDIILRAIEFIIVFVISLIGLVVGEKFDRKLYVMKLAITKSMTIAAEAEKRSLVLLNNVLPSGIVAEMSNSRVRKNLADFSVTLPDASVLQSDIVSFTLFSSSKQPHAVVEMLNSMFKKFDAHVNALGIEKLKTVGDAYVCAAGVPCADRQHAEKILSFGIRMVRSIHELNAEGVPSIPDLNIAIRVGAACGPVRAGVIAMEKMRYELFGAVAEECEKMEQTGKADRVQCSKTLYEKTSGLFNYEVIKNPESGKNQYFVLDKGTDPFFADVPASQLVTTNPRKLQDRFRILDDEDPYRQEILSAQDPAVGGKLSKYKLVMKNEKLEEEFRKYYLALADQRTSVETAQSTIMYALVASIVGIFAGSLHPVVILQIFIACLLAIITAVRVGVPVFHECRDNIQRMWRSFEMQVMRGGVDYGDDTEMFEENMLRTNKQRDRSSSIASSNADIEMSLSSGTFASSSSPKDSNKKKMSTSDNKEQVAGKMPDNHDPTHGGTILPTGQSFSERACDFIRSERATVYAVGFFTLLDPIIVLTAVDAAGIGRGSVFITLAAASFIFSQMHLLFLQKIALASVHLLAVSIAFFIRTAGYNTFTASRDGGDYVGVLCCYILCVGAAYTTERSVRKAFVASKRVERRNAEIGRTLHLCEKLLANSIPQSIVRRLQEAPDRAVVDEIPEASVLFLYVDGVVPQEESHETQQANAKQQPLEKKPSFGTYLDSNSNVFEGSGRRGTLNPEDAAALGNSSNNGDTPSSSITLSASGDVQRKHSHTFSISHSDSYFSDSMLDHENDDTPDIVLRMNDVFYVLDALCNYHMVEKIKTLPFLVVSGCPEPISKHCYRLACLARDAIEYADRYNARRDPKTPPLRIRAGINTGRVTAGVLGTSKFVYDVFGDTVNLASRLASNALWGTAACSALSKKHLEGENVNVSARGEVHLKGKGNVLVYEVENKSLKLETPNFIDDIDSYLAMSSVEKSKMKDPHTSAWSCRNSATGSVSGSSRRGSGLGAKALGLDKFQFPMDRRSTGSGSSKSETGGSLSPRSPTNLHGLLNRSRSDSFGDSGSLSSGLTPTGSLSGIGSRTTSLTVANNKNNKQHLILDEKAPPVALNQPLVSITVSNSLDIGHESITQYPMIASTVSDDDDDLLLNPSENLQNAANAAAASKNVTSRAGAGVATTVNTNTNNIQGDSQGVPLLQVQPPTDVAPGTTAPVRITRLPTTTTSTTTTTANTSSTAATTLGIPRPSSTTSLMTPNPSISTAPPSDNDDDDDIDILAPSSSSVAAAGNRQPSNPELPTFPAIGPSTATPSSTATAAVPTTTTNSAQQPSSTSTSTTNASTSSGGNVGSKLNGTPRNATATDILFSHSLSVSFGTDPDLQRATLAALESPKSVSKSNVSNNKNQTGSSSGNGTPTTTTPLVTKEVPLLPIAPENPKTTTVTQPQQQRKRDPLDDTDSDIELIVDIDEVNNNIHIDNSASASSGRSSDRSSGEDVAIALGLPPPPPAASNNINTTSTTNTLSASLLSISGKTDVAPFSSSGTSSQQNTQQQQSITPPPSAIALNPLSKQPQQQSNNNIASQSTKTKTKVKDPLASSSDEDEDDDSDIDIAPSPTSRNRLFDNNASATTTTTTNSNNNNNNMISSNPFMPSPTSATTNTNTASAANLIMNDSRVSSSLKPAIINEASTETNKKFSITQNNVSATTTNTKPTTRARDPLDSTSEDEDDEVDLLLAPSQSAAATSGVVPNKIVTTSDNNKNNHSSVPLAISLPQGPRAAISNPLPNTKTSLVIPLEMLLPGQKRDIVHILTDSDDEDEEDYGFDADL